MCGCHNTVIIWPSASLRLCTVPQVEFFVADTDLTLGHLISLLETFFHKIGITNLRFKPAYNPYTEPSMEVSWAVVWHVWVSHS